MPRTYRGLMGVGWGSIFPTTKREKRRIDDAYDYVDSLLDEYGGAYVLGKYVEVVPVNDLFTEIRDALEGVRAIVTLRYSGLGYTVDRASESVVIATLASVSGEVLLSFIMTRVGSSIETDYFVAGRDIERRSTSEHGEDVVRAFAIRFILEVL